MPTREGTSSRVASFLNGKPRSGSFPSAPAEGALHLDREEALGYLGYGKQKLDGDLEARFAALALECEKTLSPAYSWAAFAVERIVPDGECPGVDLAGTSARLVGESMAAHMKGACGVAVLSCTAGMDSERAIARYQATSPTDALFYNACAAALVEACANRVEAEVVLRANEVGLHTNWRFSPGYGDAPLSMQPDLLCALGAPGRLAVTCTDSFLLVPSKSITAVVGLFEPGVCATGVRRSCTTCSLGQVCMIRKQGRICHG